MSDAARMNCIEIREPGGPDVLTPAMRPVPRPGHGEVLIKVAAAGINRPDVFQRMGAYPPPDGASDLPGLEVAGEIADLGPGVTPDWLGRQVCALLPGGGYADYAVADIRTCLPVPDGFSMTEAAAMPETFFTVWTNVFEDGRLAEGERLLMPGGASGIGTTAIKMALAWGASVVATAGTAEKCDTLRDLGAARVFNYREDDWESAIAEGGGVDVVLDMVGGENVDRHLNCLRPGGRHVSIAFLAGKSATVDITRIMKKRLVLTGSTLRGRDIGEKGRIARELETRIWPLMGAHDLRPVVDRTFPLAEAANAHRHMEDGGHIGKIVLVP